MGGHSGAAGPFKVIVAGPVGLEGTALIAAEGKDLLRQRYPDFFIEEAEELYSKLYRDTFKKVFDRVRTAGGDAAVYPLGQTGFFGGLWRMGQLEGDGFEIDLLRVPIRQHTVEMCEFFDVNPYMLLSGGSGLIISRPEEEWKVGRILTEEGIAWTTVGETTKKKARRIHYDGAVRYLEPPGEDVLNKVLEKIRGRTG